MAAFLYTPQASLSPLPTIQFRLSPRPRPIGVIKHSTRCFSSDPDNNTGKSYKTQTETPQVLKIVVSGVTELLRLLSFSQQSSRVTEKQIDEFSASSVDDVLSILQSDYQNAYFVTGKELYSRNLKLLVPFFDSPSIGLENIEKDLSSETTFVVAKWKLRTYLKLPWRPLISINGSTVYELDGEFKIVRHAESWSVSALEAIGQIFTPTTEQPDD
ncbi:hypothetical protein CsatA_006664 [Cannabis sativa]